MGCKNCGPIDFNEKLGKCRFCVWLSFVSSLFFWGLYYVFHAVIPNKLIAWPVLVFASLVTLLLIAHFLAFLSKRFKR